MASYFLAKNEKFRPQCKAETEATRDRDPTTAAESEAAVQTPLKLTWFGLVAMQNRALVT